MNVDKIMEQGISMAVEYGPKVLGAIAVWIIGGFVIKTVIKIVMKMLNKTKTDESLKPFTKSLLGIVLKVLLVVSVLGMVGVDMTPFVALLGAAGIAIGMALTGVLQNFTGGLIILMFKPFKLGDFISAQGHSGTVSEISIFHTTLKTVDNKTEILTNGALATSSLTNFSVEEKRRVDWTFGVGYGDDPDKVRKVIREVCAQDNRILKDPDYFIALSEMADSSVNFVVRVWVKASDYWGVYFDINEAIYKAFMKENISIPYPQMDVHLDKLEK